MISDPNPYIVINSSTEEHDTKHDCDSYKSCVATNSSSSDLPEVELVHWYNQIINRVSISILENNIQIQHTHKKCPESAVSIQECLRTLTMGLVGVEALKAPELTHRLRNFAIKTLELEIEMHKIFLKSVLKSKST